MSRRRRIRRWLAAWRRLLEFGKMLQKLSEDGFTVMAFETHGAPLQVNAVERKVPHPDNVRPIGGKL